jgi:hypothetical protein
MPPRRTHESDPQSLKEKLYANARDRRTGKAAATNGSGLKEVDNASTHSGQPVSETSSSNVSPRFSDARAPSVFTAPTTTYLPESVHS